MRVAIVAGLLIGIGAIAYAATANREPQKGVLFSNLSDDDAARIVEKLRGANIPYEFGAGNTTLLVPEKQVYETRLMLASEGLPSGGGVGFEVFDQQRFGESEFTEQVKYHRALEGELARTISHLAGVKRARVHLVLPTRSLFADREQDASASVVVHLVPGWKVREDQVKGIVHLVASSVRGLDPDHVTLVDGDGRPLDRSDSREEAGELTGKADAYRRDIERSKERAAQQMLDASLGQRKSMVRVAAAVNFAREEVTEELYDPETIAQRSFQIVEEREGAGARTVGGLPGTPSNLPGGEAAVSGPGGGAGLTRRSETRNYEVSKYMRRAVEPVGRVTGLQVAVVADGRYRGTGEKKKFEPLSKDELDRIQKLVAGAVGIDEKRGDRVVVECIAFAPVVAPPDDRTLVEKTFGPYTQYVLWALMAVAAFIAYRVLNKALQRRPPALGSGAASAADLLLSRALPGSPEAQNAALPSGDAGLLDGLQNLQLGAAGTGEPALAGGAAAGETLQAAAAAQAANHAAAEPQPVKPVVIPKSLLNKGKNEPSPDAEAVEQVRQLAQDMASKEPEAAARVLRGWLNEGKEQL
ncbi:MAG TPA: flagellar basal-body MS-ring/collar protein FliF [Polyangiales bacterium]|nr:flagellar basal-body MS-ring/collar protein FliF [Polyangiales bacterium]